MEQLETAMKFEIGEVLEVKEIGTMVYSNAIDEKLEFIRSGKVGIDGSLVNRNNIQVDKKRGHYIFTGRVMPTKILIGDQDYQRKIQLIQRAEAAGVKW